MPAEATRKTPAIAPHGGSRSANGGRFSANRRVAFASEFGLTALRPYPQGVGFH